MVKWIMGESTDLYGSVHFNHLLPRRVQILIIGVLFTDLLQNKIDAYIFYINH